MVWYYDFVLGVTKNAYQSKKKKIEKQNETKQKKLQMYQQILCGSEKIHSLTIKIKQILLTNTF